LLDCGGGFSDGITEVPGDPFSLLLPTEPVFANTGVPAFSGKLE
jgi:hypothetical protein